MGLDNRDYIRYSSQQSSFGGFGGGGAWPPVCKALLALNITIFLIQLFSTGPRGEVSTIQLWFELDGSKVMMGQVWRLVTSAFCHSTGAFFHIVFNMLFLVLFGRPLERMYGSAEFLAFYLVSAVVASIAYIGLNLVTGDIAPAIGASGATMALTVLFACHFPRQKVMIWFVLPVEIRWLVAFIVVMDLLPALSALAGKNLDDIAHAAHLGGIAFGFLYFKTRMRLAPFFRKVTPGRPKSGGRKKRKPQPDLTLTGSKAQIKKQVDELLQKISDKGFQSLTEKERKFLEKASDQFGDR